MNCKVNINMEEKLKKIIKETKKTGDFKWYCRITEKWPGFQMLGIQNGKIIK